MTTSCPEILRKPAEFAGALVLMALAVCCVSVAEDPDFNRLRKLAKEKDGYIRVFDGDLTDAIYTEGKWQLEDGILSPVKTAVKKKADPNQPKPMRDIWTKERYGDFILEVEFKCAPNTNSGVFVRPRD